MACVEFKDYSLETTLQLQQKSIAKLQNQLHTARKRLRYACVLWNATSNTVRDSECEQKGQVGGWWEMDP